MELLDEALAAVVAGGAVFVVLAQGEVRKTPVTEDTIGERDFLAHDGAVFGEGGIDEVHRREALSVRE